ncbi:hypothetical protein TVAG_306450 [Trichomonas vaginalis G3]|uniref:Uncharacterized protein n=1 Tax=Trichomonas vaginalis (strain ATCC PRA-98 / G3) TaxID=412133 RepID=A2DND5_TRIV3|nr:hypothetical protein TVAGG3_1024620 [Trichomonas vaginalis G3]EAY18123.1 hypothetical protein TVAG_306450 [Trichomonas vaginalis G3]KAI5492400.1 hypothetical protein TVAGG3_1024620 [Trichomonas vaginalis G3]|eukprot:XP_001579109.1 hypothetical protein [Trichomonas vaginalis G3]
MPNIKPISRKMVKAKCPCYSKQSTPRLNSEPKNPFKLLRSSKEKQQKEKESQENPIAEAQDFNVLNKENTFEEIKDEIEDVRSQFKISIPFAFAVFNTMQVTYETPKLYSQTFNILKSNENSLPYEEGYSIKGEKEVINAIERNQRLSEEGFKYLSHIKKNYKDLKFPKKVERQFDRIIINLENN